MTEPWLKLFWLLSGVLLTLRSSLATQAESIIVATTICSRFAETTVHSLFVNNEAKAKVVEFKVLLPHEAFVTSFSLNLDGVWHDGVVEDRAKAERQFAIAKELGVAAGILGSEGISFKAFKTRSNVEPGTEVQFLLVYQQLLRRTNEKYQHEIILLGSQLTKELEIEVHICESKQIYNVKALPILSGDGTIIQPTTLLQKDYRNSASLYFVPSNNEMYMRSLRQSGGRFVVQYEMKLERNGELVVGNRNFIQFFAPPVDINPRRIVFLLDISGSMNTDDKITHMKTAMYNLIRKLSEKDRFGIISFQTDYSVWKLNSKSLSSGTTVNIHSAIRFIKRLEVNGYTEFYEPVVKAISILERDVGSDSSVANPKSNYIVMITDGRPTSSPDAEIDENQWLHNISNINRGRFAIHAIGLGNDVDNKAMGRLTAENGGTWQRLSMDINTGIQIQSYLEDLGITLLSNISLRYPDIVKSTTVLPPAHIGGEYIITGELRHSMKSSKERKFVITDEPSGEIKMEMEFVTEDTNMECSHVDRVVAANFTEKAYGLAKVMDILRAIDRTSDRKRRAKIKEQAVNLAKRHHLVTPLTSMVVLRPGDREKVEIQYTMETHSPVASTAPPATAPMTVPGWGFQGDPHMFVHLEKNLTACFEFPGVDGQIFNFLHDPLLGITVNGKATMPIWEKDKKAVRRDLYITELAVILKKEKILLMVTPFKLTADEMHAGPKQKPLLHLPVTEVEDYKKTYGPVTLVIRNTTYNHTIASVFLASDANFEIRLELYRYDRLREHINLEVFGTSDLSSNVGGIFGSFSRKESYGSTEVRISKGNGKKAMLKFRDKWIPAEAAKVWMDAHNRQVLCWHVKNVAALLGSGVQRFEVMKMLDEPAGKRKRG